MERIDFATEPARYRHWRLRVDGTVAELILDVDPSAGLFPGTELKLNSYDLGVDIELADAVQRLRFEYPAVRAVVLRSAKPGVFCAGANIRMLARASHAHKVNFCKFTNETRLAIEDATEHSGQVYLAAVNGACAGGGYELAMAAAHIMLIDDRRSTVALPEAPLLGVLPGTGGLTRLTDKRRVRRDRADVFATLEEGIRGARAVEWRLVDEVVPPSLWEEAVATRAAALASRSDRPDDAPAVALPKLRRELGDDIIRYDYVRVELDRAGRRASLTIAGPHGLPDGIAGIEAEGAAFWPLAVARELDDALLHLRFNEPTLGLLLLRTEGDPAAVLAADALLEAHQAHWLVRGGPASQQARAEAAGPHLAQRRGVDRAGELLCRHVGRARLRRRPRGDVRGQARRRQPTGGDPASEPAELRRLSDEQRPHPARDPLLGRARERRSRPGVDRRGARQ